MRGTLLSVQVPACKKPGIAKVMVRCMQITPERCHRKQYHFFALPIAPLFLSFVEAGAFAAALGAGLVEVLGAVLAAGLPEDP